MKIATSRAGLAKARAATGASAVLILLLTMLGGLDSMAANPPLEELRTAEQVRRLSTQQADLHYPVRLHGVVTFFDDRIPTKSFRFIQDETAGIYVYSDAPTNGSPLRVGQWVEIEGETGAGSFAPVVTAHRIRVLGQTNLPWAKPVSLEQVTSGLEDSQFVELRGLVRAVRFDQSSSNYIIDLASGQGRLTMSATKLPVADSGQLVDATVRVRGVCMSRFNGYRQLFDTGLLVPLPEDLVIESPAPNDPRAMPAQPIKSLMLYTWGATYGHRVKVMGTVTLCNSNKFYIQDETEGLCVTTRQQDDLAIGDQVEVLGFPARGEYAPVLQNGAFRRLAPGQGLKPDNITPDEALTGSHDCRLVQIRATLLERAQLSKDPFLVLQTAGVVFHAYLKAPGWNEKLDSLENGSQLALTGICVIDDLGENWHPTPDWRAESFRLLLRFPGDVIVLQQPPWWTLPRLFGAIGILSAILLAAFGWVVLLRKRVQQQTRTIRQQLQVEAALKERYVNLFENANDMVFTHDLTGRITSINAIGEQLFQRPRAEILALSLMDLLPADQQVPARQWLDQIVKHSQPPTVELDFLNAGQQRFRLEISTRIIEWAGKKSEVESIGRDITERKRLEKEILEVSNREQRRIGYDLHDGVCQQLAATSYLIDIHVDQLEEKGSPEAADAQRIGQLVAEAITQTRGISRRLFPVKLKESGLASALEELAENMASLFKIDCQCASPDRLPELDDTLALHLYYIAQEAVLNAAKHGRAAHVRIALTHTGNVLSLTVQDDGIGINLPTAAHAAGMGIRIMRYRARVIGGILELSRRPDRGTQVQCELHLSPKAVESKQG